MHLLVFLLSYKFFSARPSVLLIWRAVPCLEFKTFRARGSIVFHSNYGWRLVF